MDLDFTGYIVTFLSGLGALFVFLQVRALYRARVEAARKKEMAIQLHKLRDTNDLLVGAKKFPFSKELFTCLYHRLLTTLTALQELEPENKKVASRAEYVKDKLKLLETTSSSVDKKRFNVPSNEIEAVELLKLIKKFRVVVRTAHTKGQINSHGFVYENTRLDSFQTRIIIGNLIKRTNYTIERNKTGIAKELIRKGITYLNSKSGTHSIDTVVELVEQLEMIERKLTGEDQFHELISSSFEEPDDAVPDNDSAGSQGAPEV